MLQVQWEIVIFLKKKYFVMAGNSVEIRSAIWYKIIQIDICTTNFVF
jgi:hypothetical protein